MAKVARTKLSREDMVKVIKGGGSVLHGGEIITDIKALPDAADLAETDEELADAAAEVDAEEKKVAAKKTKLQSKKPAAKK